MVRHFPDNIMTALKDAIINVFWTKKDLRSLLVRCDIPAQLISAQDWNGYKFHIVDPILESLNSSSNGLGPLRRLVSETLQYTDGNHLLRFGDGQKRKREAERCLDHLRLLVDSHDTKLREEQDRQQVRRKKQDELLDKQRFNQILNGLNDEFKGFNAASDRQARGYDFEKILFRLFELFDLDPKGSFRVKGEQIDGAFVLDGYDYLLEAKWQQSTVSLNELRDLDGAVSSNLDNTLGLFVAVNGFGNEALDRYRQGNRPRIICMDGLDITYALGGLIDFTELLRRKRAIASQTGKIFVRADEILRGMF